MKLTKGKLAKLINKKKQTMKKNKKGKREKNGRRKTFRRRKHLNLMKKTLKKWSGGENDEETIEKPLESLDEVKDESNIDTTSFLETLKEREDEVQGNADETLVENNSEMIPGPEPVVEPELIVKTAPNVESETIAETDPIVESETIAETDPIVESETIAETAPIVESETIAETAPIVESETIAETTPIVESEPEPEPEPEPIVETDPIVESETIAETAPIVEPQQENVSITINTTMDDLINNVAKKVISMQQTASDASVDQKLVDASVTNAENASL